MLFSFLSYCVRVRVRVKYGQYSFVLLFIDIVVAVNIDVRTFFLSYFILLTELAVLCVNGTV